MAFQTRQFATFSYSVQQREPYRTALQSTVRAAAETTTKLMIIETRGLEPLQTVRATSLSFQWNFSFHSALRAGTLCIQKSTDNLKRNLEKK